MSNFSNMSKEAQASAVETTAQLKALGIDAQTSAANFEILNGALGMSAQQAGEVQKDFAAMAADLGVSAAKISKDFERNADVFVAYGEQATEVFKEVAAAAKATGIELDALLGITTQFDTFEGAAKAAGTLNAVLGGGVLNSMDLLNASEEERVRLLIQSIQLSGKSWESMSKFEKQAVANAAGINDMTAASKLFGQSLSEYDAAQMKVEDNAAAQEELAARAAAATNMMDKLKRIMEQFAVAVMPIVNFVHTLLNGFLALNDMMGGFLVPTIIGLLGVYKLWSIAQKSAIAGTTMEILLSKGKAMWAIIVTKAQALKTAASNIDTTSIFANTGAQVSNTLATMRSSAAKAWNTIRTTAMSAATKISTFFNWGQAASQTAVGTTATVAAPGTFVLSKGITAIGKAAARYIVPLAVLAAALLGLGLAIAAPLILIAVIIWSLKDLTIAMLEMTDAIGPALLGLVAFIGIVAVGLPVIALAIVAFFWILTGAIAPVMMLQAALPTIVLTLMGIGVALWILGNAIKQFVGDDMPGAMALAVVSLIAFGIGLFIASFFIRDGALLVGAVAFVLGAGLWMMGKGLQEWNDVGWDQAVMALVSLAAFGVALFALSFIIGPGAFAVGAVALLLGFGLQAMGKGLQEWNDVGWKSAVLALASLAAFGVMLFALSFIIGPGAFAVGAAALLLGWGLQQLGKGIKEFNKISLGDMIELAVSLSAFAILLIPAGWALQMAGAAMMMGAIATSVALWALAKGLSPWMEWREAWGDLPKLGWALMKFSIGIGIAGLIMRMVGPGFLVGAIMIGLGLLVLNIPLRVFADTLAVLAPVSGAMPAIAFGLAAIGLALIPFALGLTVLGVAAMFPWFWLGMLALGTALTMFGIAMSAIPTEKAKALGQMFEGLTFLTDLKGVGAIMMELADGIYSVAHALSFMPEGEQAVSFKFAAEGLSMLADASVGVTAEGVANVSELASAAIKYGIASRLMRSSAEDALVGALKELVGLSKTNADKQSGQDIVLELDGNEFARAVDAAIDSKHGVSF